MTYVDRADAPLRVGFLLDSMRVSAWVYHMLEQLTEADYCRPALVVLPAPSTAAPRSIRQKLGALGPGGKLLAEYYLRWDARGTAPEHDPFRSRNAADLLRDVPSIAVSPQRTRFSDRFAEHDIEQIRKFELDVIVRVGFRVLRGDILRSARYGVWSLHHGDAAVNRGGPAGFWEVIDDHPTTGATLQILSEELDGGTVLCRSWSASKRGSVAANRASYYWKTAMLVPRMLKRLHQQGEASFFAAVRAANRHPTFYCQRLYTTPKNAQLAPLLGKLVARKIRRRLSARRTFRQWILLYRFGDTPARAPHQFRRLVPPPDRFWADPIVCATGDAHYVFLEELLYADGKGRIAVATLTPDGSFSTPQVVLERPYHLSYPFLLRWNGELYMIPESAQNKTIDAYRCVRFPDEWVLDRTLMQDTIAYDSTLFEHDGRWWLFANVVEHPGIPSTEELFVFHADSPLSTEWISHPLNPVISDVRRARPAGPVFRHNGALYRPSQDSAELYGHKLRLNEIVTLNPCEYEEREVSVVEPAWDRRIVGVHHLAFDGQLTMMDAQLLRRGVPRTVDR